MTLRYPLILCLFAVAALPACFGGGNDRAMQPVGGGYGFAFTAPEPGRLHVLHRTTGEPSPPSRCKRTSPPR